MSTFTRAKRRRQFRHPDSLSQSHKADKDAGERRQAYTYVRVLTPERPSPSRDFGPYLTGHAFRFEGGACIRCTKPEEFADFLEREADRRNTFYAWTERGGQPVRMKRRAATPIEVSTTTFAPWLSDWILAMLHSGHAPLTALAKLRNEWFQRARARVESQRLILGLAFHCDTSDPHFDLCLSRQDGGGGRIGHAGLRLVGPWCIAVDRQRRAGAEISPRKQQQLARSVANFRHRYGADAVPLDVQLARDLDGIADEVIGPQLAQCKAAYAARVPELERAHEAAELAALDAARAALHLKPAPTPSLPHPRPGQSEPSRSDYQIEL